MHVTEVFTTCMIQRVTAHPYWGVDSPGNHTGTRTYQHCERWAFWELLTFWKAHWLVYKKTHIYFLRLQIRFKKTKITVMCPSLAVAKPGLHIEFTLNLSLLIVSKNSSYRCSASPKGLRK